MNIGRCKHPKPQSGYRTFSAHPSPPVSSCTSSVSSFPPSQAHRWSAFCSYNYCFFPRISYKADIMTSFVCVWLLSLSMLWLWHSLMVVCVSREFFFFFFCNCKAIFHWLGAAHSFSCWWTVGLFPLWDSCEWIKLLHSCTSPKT